WSTMVARAVDAPRVPRRCTARLSAWSLLRGGALQARSEHRPTRVARQHRPSSGPIVQPRKGLSDDAQPVRRLGTLADRIGRNGWPGGAAERCGAPVFVLCMGRSGSTLLRFLLDAHPELACPPETSL